MLTDGLTIAVFIEPLQALVERGGVLMLVIGALSFAAWFAATYSWLGLRQERPADLSWASEVVRLRRLGETEEAITLANRHGTILGRLLLAAMELTVDQSPVAACDRTQRRRHRSKLTMQLLLPLLDAERVRMTQALKWVLVAGAVLPLLGLLGTVLGMMTTFGGVGQSGAIAPNVLADGVSQALLTTQAGLVAALPVIALHAWIAGRMNSYFDRVEQCCQQMAVALSVQGGEEACETCPSGTVAQMQQQLQATAKGGV